jgi:hypothetical protein
VTASYPDPNDPKAVIFSGTGGDLPSGSHITTSIDWGNVPYCTPSGADGTTACALTQIDFNDGTGAHDQTFCSAAPGPTGADWCTTSQKFSYVSDGNGGTLTHITETWDGIGDPSLGHP